MKYIAIDSINHGDANEYMRMHRKCSKCDSDIRNSDKYCGQCGHKLKTLSEYVSMSEVVKLIDMNFGSKEERKKKDIVINDGEGPEHATFVVPKITVSGSSLSDCIDSVLEYLGDHLYDHIVTSSMK